MTLLYHKQRHLAPLHRKRVRSLLLAYAILLVLGTNDLLPILDYDYYPYTQIKIYPFGNIGAVFYVIVVGYSVLQHQLLDLHVTLSKWAAHIVRLLFLFFTGFVLLAFVATLFREEFTPFSFASALIILLFSAAIASFFFPRLFGTGVDRLERRILGDRFGVLTKSRASCSPCNGTDSTSLLDGLHDLLVKTIKVRSYQIVVLDEKMRTFSLFRSHPERPETLLPKLRGIRLSLSCSRIPGSIICRSKSLTRCRAKLIWSERHGTNLKILIPSSAFRFFRTTNLSGCF